MFTGIIEAVSEIKSVSNADAGARRVVLETPWSADELSLGESIAVNGVCLTATEIASLGAKKSEILFFLSAETLSRSNLGKLEAGSRVNLERALLASTRLSGHIVQGHVDGLATLHRTEASAESHLLEIDLPESLSRYCVEKGSISINGVSLTINRLERLTPNGGARIHITLIPHTWTHTSFPEFRSGDLLNIEVDVLAKYVEKLCHPYLNRSSS